MKIPEFLKPLFRRGNPSRAKSSQPLREFVYLDEVSVYSLLASRKQGIATQFTESQTASLNSELGSSLNVGLPGLGGNVDAKTQSSQSQASQVIRKATVQTSFKELYDLEKGNLSLSTPSGANHPTIKSSSDIKRHFDTLSNDKWIVDVGKMSRGDLLEAKVELEADPIFHMTTFITTLHDIIGDRDDIFGSVSGGQIREAYAVGQVLERLLAGLVPLRGRIVDYEAIQLGDVEILAHRTIKDQLGESCADSFRPVYITGVAHPGLFWKDTRQILFSGAHYNAFCRLATEGLKESWQPVKVADIFEGVVSDFKEAIGNFSEVARVAMQTQGKVETTMQYQGGSIGIELVNEYVRLLEEFHKRPVSSELKEVKIIAAIPLGDWLYSVADRRAVFGQVTNLVEKELNVETPGDVRLSFREQVLGKAGLEATVSNINSTQGPGSETDLHPPRFLDTEIVAVYW